MVKSPGKSLARWSRGALVFVLLYVAVYTVFPLVCENFQIWSRIEPLYKYLSKAEIKDAMNAAFSVALIFISVQYSGLFFDFYQKLTLFGITDVRPNRKGQDPALTPMWIDRISASPEVMIIGTKSRGWFIKAKDELDHFLETNRRAIRRFDVYLLDPHGNKWRSMVNGESQFKSFIKEVSFVLDSISELCSKHPCIKLYFYDTEPLHCVVARREIYFAIALPFQDPASYPEITISQGSYLGNKIYEEAIKKLQESSALVSENALRGYCDMLRHHMDRPSAEYWSCTTPA